MRLTRHVRRAARLVDETVREVASIVRAAVVRRAPAAARGAAPRILVVDEMLPDPRFGAGYPRAARLLEAIVAAGWRVDAYPMIAASADYSRVRAAFPTVRFHESRGEGGLRRLVRRRADAFDVVLVSRSPVMEAFTRISRRLPRLLERAVCVYDAEAVFASRDARRLELFGTPMSDAEQDAALAREMGLVAPARIVLTVSEPEATLFRARTTAEVRIVAHHIPARAGATPFEERADLLFVGRSEGPREFSPNVDSLVWFVEEVMPLLEARLERDCRLVVAGIVDAPLVARLASPRVRFVGVVDDLTTLYDGCRVFVAPTRFAAGIPLKVVEAAAFGLPCVVTDLLATLLGFDDGVELLAAGDAAAFAAACARLLDDGGLWRDVRAAALRRIDVQFSASAFDGSVRRVLERARGMVPLASP